MRTNTFTFNSTQFEKISPFYMLLDENLTIISFGESAAKLFMLDGKQSFCSLFKIVLPAITQTTFETLKQVKDEVFMLEQKTLRQYTCDIIKHFLHKYDDDVMMVAEKLDIGKSTIYKMIQQREIVI